MPDRQSRVLWRILSVLSGVLVLKVTAAVVLGYGNYFPPDFNSDFLRGREAYFAARYQWAFYPHLAAGPLSMVLGALLVSDRFRARFPAWHRRLGRMQIASVLLLVAPSGLVMAWDAQAGPVAAVSFAVLSILTATCAALGWRTAVLRRFAQHRRWMWRCFLLLCSAVVLRVMGGLATVLGIHFEWLDPLMAWACWILPISAYELGSRLPPFIVRYRVITAHRDQRAADLAGQPG